MEYLGYLITLEGLKLNLRLYKSFQDWSTLVESDDFLAWLSRTLPGRSTTARTYQEYFHLQLGMDMDM